MSAKVIGYWVDSDDGESDSWWCAECVEAQGKPKDRPVEELFIPLPCGYHAFL